MTKTLQPVALSVQKLAAVYDPFEYPPWDGVLKITRQEVARALADQRYEPSCWTTPEDDEVLLPKHGFGYEFVQWTPERHVARIAYLVAHGWNEPIEVDAGWRQIEYEPVNPVIDGNHRLAAAIYRGDETIIAYVGGSPKDLERFLP